MFCQHCSLNSLSLISLKESVGSGGPLSAIPVCWGLLQYICTQATLGQANQRQT